MSLTKDWRPEWRVTLPRLKILFVASFLPQKKSILPGAKRGSWIGWTR